LEKHSNNKLKTVIAVLLLIAVVAIFAMSLLRRNSNVTEIPVIESKNYTPIPLIPDTEGKG